MRKLVTVRTISEVLPIEGADMIEVVKIDGWQCVAKKGEFSVGDSAAYFEIDSFLPAADPRYAFMEGRGVQTNGDGSKGYRLRTIKLKGQLSQGLALPVSMFPETELLTDMDDFSNIIGVTKWEPSLPASLSGCAKGNFPGFIPKTDQERIQNMPWLLSDAGEWEVTQKLDGSSMTVFWNEGVFGVCSRNLELKETEGNTFWRVANRLGLREKLESLGDNLAIQGELMGPGIQGNPSKLANHDFYVFDVFNIDTQSMYGTTERLLLTDTLGINHVPLITGNMSLTFKHGIPDILTFAESITDQTNPNNPRPEGVVFKRLDGKESFKVISNKYLLKAD